MKTNYPPRIKGQSLVEMALVLPVLLLISVVTIDLGRAVYYYSAIYNAAREGARYGIINPNDITGIEDKAIDMAIAVDLSHNDVSVIPDPPNQNTPTIQVLITYKFGAVTPLARLIMPCGCNLITLKASSTMYVER